MTSPPPTLLPEHLMLPTATFRSATLKSFVRVQWFIHLRWVAVAVSFVVAVAGLWAHTEEPRPWAVLGVVGVLAGINLCWMAWSKRLGVQETAGADANGQLHKRIVRFANAQISVDLLLLTLVLHFYGAVSNPMAIIYVFHMVIASLLLRPINALLQGVWAMALYGLLLLSEYTGLLAAPFPLFGGQVFADLHAHGDLVAKTFAAVCFGVFGTWHMTSQVAAALDARESEVRARDAALDRSRREIDELVLRRARFMRTAAHQLKSPLTGIQTMAKVIADQEVDATGAAALIGKIIRRCRDAIGHVEELLTLARIKESPRTRHRVARTYLADMIATVAQKYRPFADHKDITFACPVPADANQLPREASCVRVDARDLEDCLGNLVDNAIKYTPARGRVELSCAYRGNFAVVRVRDTGPGIEPGMQQSIFDEFRRGNHALVTRIPGSGLGLSIVREIVEQAGGSVTVTSPINKLEGAAPGSEFELQLPLCSHPPADERT